MNRNLLNIVCLSSLGLYLLGNIAYDLTNKPTIEQLPDPGLANPYLVYIPMAIFLYFMTLFGKDYTKNQLPKFHIWWWFFNILSISQCVKIILFNPFVQTINDYFFMILAIVGVIYKW